ncbi:glycosidase [Tenacibaculum sp. UWU-22]|uniref:glycosidase n=1 Tax=Tenacibaculum sp. UWU-22 TaxID=3234187 RepID=UPI0034DB2525
MITQGVMLNAYPDSIGKTLSDTIAMLKKKEFKNVFSLFYVLPTFFNSDLDRGFSIIDYNLNKNLVSKTDLETLKTLGIELKLDIVLNHLSVASPQFKDLLQNGENSEFKNFFINWNEFWKNNGTINDEGIVIPKKEFLNKLFMRKSGLPILKVPFPDGTEKPYWNTFYQQIEYKKITPEKLVISQLNGTQKSHLCKKINNAIDQNKDIASIDFNELNQYKTQILKIVKANATLLGQMDVNAKSDLVWKFYTETLNKINNYGCKILRLDAFAYLHKEVGQTNFFNTPGTWQYLKKIKKIASKNNLMLLPEIHAEYGAKLHNQVAEKGYHVYDFFLPGLMIHTLETASNKALLNWINEIIEQKYKTVNMLGCHDGIPVLDLKGKEINGNYNKGLLKDEEIETIINLIIKRGGRVKNLYSPEGKKISYYQVNATFFSALGESEEKLLLARAIQMFVPGIAQVWYLDIFAGKNNYLAADKGGSAAHKEINRTTLSKKNIEAGLKQNIVINQLKIMQLKNTLKAFSGKIKINPCAENELNITWSNQKSFAQLKANLTTYRFTITYTKSGINKTLTF